MKTREKRTTTSFIKRVQDNEEEKEQIDFLAIQRDLFIELNNLRKNPKSYIPLIESEMKSLKKNNILKKKDSKTTRTPPERRISFKFSGFRLS